MINALKSLKKNLRGNLTAQLGLFITLLVIFVMVLGPYLAPHDPKRASLKDRLLPPYGFKGSSAHYLLGTDGNGRDILSRVILGARVSVSIGVISSLFAAAFGTLMGLLAGYYGGRIDTIIMRIGDIMLAFPAIVLAIIVVAVLGPGLINLIIALSLYVWVWFARTIRGEVLHVKEMQYVESSRACGASDLRLIVSHILPNVISATIVLATMEIGHLITLETALSFFGLSGMKSSWGYDIALGRVYLGTAWWATTIPGLACFITIIGFNLVGDWLRDTFDPKTY
jgi:peptide/nickel transport system permease protein